MFPESLHEKSQYGQGYFLGGLVDSNTEESLLPLPVRGSTPLLHILGRADDTPELGGLSVAAATAAAAAAADVLRRRRFCTASLAPSSLDGAGSMANVDENSATVCDNRRTPAGFPSTIIV